MDPPLMVLFCRGNCCSKTPSAIKLASYPHVCIKIIPNRATSKVVKILLGDDKGERFV